MKTPLVNAVYVLKTTGLEKKEESEKCLMNIEGR